MLFIPYMYCKYSFLSQNNLETYKLNLNKVVIEQKLKGMDPKLISLSWENDKNVLVDYN